MGEVPEETVRELYTALPEEFVAGRDAAAAAAKAAGHGPVATAIARLRRPTVAGWLVNLLSHRAPERVAELTALAGELRAAQRQLRGDDLRILTVRRRELLAGLAAEAGRLAVLAQPSLTPAKLPLAEVEQTLAAALADDEVAAQVRAGTVVKAVSYTGFGAALGSAQDEADDEADDEEYVPVRSGRAGRRTRSARPPEPPVDELATMRRRRAARSEPSGRDASTERPARTVSPGRPETVEQARRAERPPVGLTRGLEAARKAEEQAEAELARARDAEDAAADELSRIRDALAALEERREEAQQEADRRRAARTSAERGLAAAVRRTARAQAALDARAAG